MLLLKPNVILTNGHLFSVRNSKVQSQTGYFTFKIAKLLSPPGIIGSPPSLKIFFENIYCSGLLILTIAKAESIYKCVTSNYYKFQIVIVISYE